jgi:hypothetical protein
VESNDPTTRSRQIPPDPTISHQIPPDQNKCFKKCAYAS